MGIIVDSGAIIPYASGAPFQLATRGSGIPFIIQMIGFGTSESTLFNVTIDLTEVPDNLAFSVPRDGIITSIAAFFSSTVSLSIPGSTITITAQLWSSPTPDNIFTPVAGTAVTLAPPLTGEIVPGTTSKGLLENLAIPVTAETRLLMVFSATAEGETLVTAVTGNASAGVNID